MRRIIFKYFAGGITWRKPGAKTAKSRERRNGGNWSMKFNRVARLEYRAAEPEALTYGETVDHVGLGEVDGDLFTVRHMVNGAGGLRTWYESLTPWTGVESPDAPRSRAWIPGNVLQLYDLADREDIRLQITDASNNRATLALSITRVYDPMRHIAGIGTYPYLYPAPGREAPDWGAVTILDDAHNPATIDIEVWRGAWRPLFSLPSTPVNTQFWYALIKSQVTLGYRGRKPSGTVIIEARELDQFHDPDAVIRISLAGREIPLYVEAVDYQQNWRAIVTLTLNTAPKSERDPIYI